MGRKIQKSLFFITVFTLVCASFYHRLFQIFNVDKNSSSTSTLYPRDNTNLHTNLQFVIREETQHHQQRGLHLFHRRTQPDSVLLHDWEVLLILPSSAENFFPSNSGEGYFCLFQNGATSPAKPSGALPWGNRTTLKCTLPDCVRRLRPFFTPTLTPLPENLQKSPVSVGESPEMLRWSFLTYELLSTEADVILFAKGVNGRHNRPTTELRCVFGDAVNVVKTAVVSSSQEVFRCLHPDAAARDRFLHDEKIKVTLEVGEERRVLPSVAYYAPVRSAPRVEHKVLLCACTMVYNVAKFLKEWVIYHSNIGVEKFLLYDNGSEDDLEKVIQKLLEEGYDVSRLLWPWPKTQEAGFSHCSTVSRDSCTWMIFIDVDEFLFSPTWLELPYPTRNMLKSILPNATSSAQYPIGQISMKCYEFGPSDQKLHPHEGVTQGYTCRRRLEQRHKSIVLLDAVDTSLVNVIHHFKLREGYRAKKLLKKEWVVNHYKYQAWSEFKAKFRRRVSANVVDWRQAVNPGSKDRTPGLGFVPVEPKGWAKRFCEVNDRGLREVSRKWFGVYEPTGFKMAWEEER